MHEANIIYLQILHIFDISWLIFFNFNFMNICVLNLTNSTPRIRVQRSLSPVSVILTSLPGQFDACPPNSVQDKNSNLGSCDFYNKPSAAKDFIALLKKGRSQSWEKTLFEMLGTKKFKTESMLVYFRPLIQWLENHKKENGWVTGWKLDSKWKPIDFNKNAFTPKCNNS